MLTDSRTADEGLGYLLYTNRASFPFLFHQTRIQSTPTYHNSHFQEWQWRVTQVRKQLQPCAEQGPRSLFSRLAGASEMERKGESAAEVSFPPCLHILCHAVLVPMHFSEQSFTLGRTPVLGNRSDGPSLDEPFYEDSGSAL